MAGGIRHKPPAEEESEEEEEKDLEEGDANEGDKGPRRGALKKPANRKRRRIEEDGAGTPRAEEEAKRKELRATLEKKHQVDQYKAVDKRIFQLSDSYIYIYKRG